MTSDPTPEPEQEDAERGVDVAQGPDSEWERFLTGKETPAAFMKRVAKGPLTLPSNESRQRCIDALVAVRARAARLLALLQNSAKHGATITRISFELAAAFAERLQILPASQELDGDLFRDRVSAWLDGIRVRPLKAADMTVLFILLLVGNQREVMTEETAFNVVASAVLPRLRKAGKKKKSPTLPVTPIQLLLAGSPAAAKNAVLNAAAWKVRISELNEVIDAERGEIERWKAECASCADACTRLEAERDNLRESIIRLQTEIATLTEQNVQADATAADLREQISELRNGYQHKLDDLRGRLRGVLQGELTRWLQTALEAAQSDPPWISAIQERLEDSLKLIEKEAQWLQRSA